MPDRIPDDVAGRVVELYKAGAKTADIVEQTGVTRATIYWLLQREGVDPNRIGTRRARPDSEDIGEVLQWALRRIEEQAREVGRLQAIVEQHRAQLDRERQEMDELQAVREAALAEIKQNKAEIAKLKKALGGTPSTRTRRGTSK